MTNRWPISYGAAALVVLLQVPAFAQAPALMPVQGVLTNADGVPLDGSAQVTFTLYDAPTLGTAFYAETLSVEVANGVFSVYLGTDVNNPLDLVNFQMPEIYLGLQVEDNAEMIPRFRLATTPYAGFAQYCGDASSLGGQTSADFAPTTHTHAFGEVTNVPDFAADTHGHPWGDLTGVPAGLADGDDDTRYTAGAGLNAAGTMFSVDDSYVQRRISQTCPNGGLRQVNADGTVECDTDDNTTYQAGTGMSLRGTTFSVEEYANLARKDAAAGNQVFDTRTLVLDYTNNYVGVNQAAPSAPLDVGGDIELTGNIRPSSSRTFYHFVAPTDFDSSSSNFINTGLYIYASSSLTMSLYARPKMPNGATVRTVTCYLYDNGTGLIEDFNIYFFRRAYTASAGSQLGSDINANLNYQDGTVRSFSIANLTEVVDNARNEYYIFISFDLPGSVTSGFAAYRFYGCRMTYAMDRFSTF